MGEQVNHKGQNQDFGVEKAVEKSADISVSTLSTTADLLSEEGMKNSKLVERILPTLAKEMTFGPLETMFPAYTYFSMVNNGSSQEDALSSSGGQFVGGYAGGEIGIPVSRAFVTRLVPKFLRFLPMFGSEIAVPPLAVATATIVGTVLLAGELSDLLKEYGPDIWKAMKEEFGNYVNSDYANSVAALTNSGLIHFDPLVINLDGNGIKLTNIDKSNAMFDLTGSGFANKTGWISSGDAFLVWDRNNNGRIDDISEMFGNSKESGFRALALYDTNRDGRIDAFDDVFKNLKLWQDRNGDGRTDEGELLSLSDAGIKAINLNTTQTNINQEGNTITEIAEVEFEDGRETQAGNVNFELDRLYSYYNREVELNPEIVGLPWVRGYGFMPDLPIAMSN